MPSENYGEIFFIPFKINNSSEGSILVKYVKFDM